ncbi:MAG: nucleotide exchange factor GrpE [Bdellovibrionales bacterium]|jgi:molecular chaperone GrpE|nr:nucleotide exchange factor GrpE [Bdellovibrionales bacterium]MBT3525704.1 nucleotide exchange factor GrpE [Bdellovibrionales bacterium]MBT7668994.1 nucleotide exchange factor GrpE [Bdellovibrionales bacterium]MBT7767724.1 nucleotide exchange factor GrpE [Bdellovibrionales bacterium]
MSDKKQEVEVDAEVEAEMTQEVNEDGQQDHDQGEETEESKVESIEPKKEEVDYQQKYYYLAAEMENARKRFEREKEVLRKYGNEKILSGLVDVVDNLERTVGSLDGELDEKMSNIVAGVEMVQKQLLGVLNDNGLEQLHSLGEIFDPNFHEAMAQQEAEGKQDQEIIVEYQKGYVLNGRLLRPAKVVVAQGSGS